MIYLDNAATTPMLPEVIEAVHQSMQTIYGNPSSSHGVGREAKTAVETARKAIAKHLNVSAQEIVFTSGGTESINLVLYNAVVELGIQTVITSPVEHHAVLHALDHLSHQYGLQVLLVQLNDDASIDFEHLEQLLQAHPESKMLSLMMVNNELGTLLDIQRAGELCAAYQTLFLCDTVQAVGHYALDLQQIKVDFITASAHKFHGPKGVGFLFVRKGRVLQPILHGAPQEHGLRAGTENVHSIIGMAKALDLAYQNLESDSSFIRDLKKYFATQLHTHFPEICFNGNSDDGSTHAYHILNVRFPFKIELFLFKLDLKGIAASGGSACQSGSDKGSHVLKAILSEKDAQKTSVRFSFSKFNTREEMDRVLEVVLGFKV
jgi:cysteine desulfurase